MISLLINIVILIVVFGLLYYLVTLLPLPPQFLKAAQVVLILILVLVLLGIIFGGVPLMKLSV